MAQSNSFLSRPNLMPQSVKAAYAELVRIGVPSGNGFNEKMFQMYYKN